MACIYIETFGCQMNEADSQEIIDRASAAGYEVTSDPSAASVVVLNTCTVRDSAERRAYGRMAHLRALKTGDSRVKLIVCGCLAEQDRDRMRLRAPYLDGVFGTSDVARLGEQLAAWRPGFEDFSEASEARALLRLGGEADCIAGAFSHLRAFVTVQRGCSYYCTFCIVPYVRGRFDHRPMDEILADVRAAIARGAGAPRRCAATPIRARRPRWFRARWQKPPSYRARNQPSRGRPPRCADRAASAGYRRPGAGLKT